MARLATPNPVVTVFLVHNGKVLLLRRSGRVRTFPGRWAGVSGSIPPGTTPLAQAYQEIMEEPGIPPEGLSLCTQGTPLLIPQREGVASAPLRFLLALPLGHTLGLGAHRYALGVPEGMRTLPTVPGLREAWERVCKRGAEQ
ncbi:MAG: NUDIX domain-containing protein [Dehalococcoidia bacterium]